MRSASGSAVSPVWTGPGGDVPPAELADYCLHALGAAAGDHTKAAVERLVRVTMAGLRPG